MPITRYKLNEFKETVETKLIELQKTNNKNKELFIFRYGNDIGETAYINSLARISKKCIPELKIHVYSTSAFNYSLWENHISNNKNISSKMLVMKSCIFYKINNNFFIEHDHSKLVDAVYLFITKWLTIKDPVITIIGRNSIGGLYDMLKQDPVTIVQCNSHTHNLNNFICLSDIIVTCAGKLTFDLNYCKENAIIIDCGYPGDIPNDEEFNKKIYKDVTVTSNPGGIGSITPYMVLMEFFK